MISASLDLISSSIWLHMLVRELLDVLFRPRLVVFRDVLELLDLAQRVGPRVADGDAPFLGQLVHHLDQFLAPLLGQRRQRHPDDVALRGGIEAEVAVANGLLDGLAPAPLSNGCTVSSRGSGAATIATWFSGTCEP